MRTLQVACITAALSIPGIRVGGATLPAQVEGHHSGFAARLVLANGSSRNVHLAGAGCTETMCSRVFLMTTAGRVWLDSIASIQDPHENTVVFLMKDGRKQRLALTSDFRVLYVVDEHGRGEKIDLKAIRSVAF